MSRLNELQERVYRLAGYWPGCAAVDCYEEDGILYVSCEVCNEAIVMHGQARLEEFVTAHRDCCEPGLD